MSHPLAATGIRVHDGRRRDARLFIEATLGAGTPAGQPAGSPRNIAMAGNWAGVPLSFGTRYEFRLSINGETDDLWTVGFDTPPQPVSKAA